MTFDSSLLDSGLFGTPGDKILLPIMGYPSERDASFIALVTAEYFGATLHVFHLASKSKKKEQFIFKELEWIKKKATEYNVKLEIKIKDSLNGFSPENSILDEINILTPKLTIMMSRRRRFFQRFNRSIAERVARRSRYSVMIVRSPLSDNIINRTNFPPKQIVVPIGEVRPSEISAIQIAIALANAGKTEDADITLLHAIMVPETVPIISGDDKMLLAEEKNFVKQAGMFSTMLLYPMKTKVVVGRDIGRSVSRFLNKRKADVAILGIPYVPRKFLGLFGTDTNEIYRRSKCPIIVIFHKDIIYT